MSEDKQSTLDTIQSQLTVAFNRWYQGDPFGYLDLMADEMTYFSPFANELMVGKAFIYAAMAPIEGQIHSQYSIHDMDIQLGIRIAVNTYRLMELDEEGQQTAGYKVTEIYRLMEGQWRMIHAHFSAIAEAEE